MWEADNTEWFDDWEDLAEKREDCYIQGWEDCVEAIKSQGMKVDIVMQTSIQVRSIKNDGKLVAAWRNGPIPRVGEHFQIAQTGSRYRVDDVLWLFSDGQRIIEVEVWVE